MKAHWTACMVISFTICISMHKKEKCKMRKTYIDNIRSSTVLLVLIYHVCYMFNGVGVPGGIPNVENIPAFDALTYVVYPWFIHMWFYLSSYKL